MGNLIKVPFRQSEPIFRFHLFGIPAPMLAWLYDTAPSVITVMIRRERKKARALPAGDEPA